MANNFQVYAKLADDTAAQITGSYQEWTAFLTTAARLYKYPYSEQLMIYAQRPEATACASYDLWNQRMGRYVRRGSRGIALIDMTGDKPKIKYVFDVSDTGKTERSRRVNLWEYRQEHAQAVSAMLERRYEVTGENGIEEQLEKVAAQLADEYWNDHQRDILGIVDDSFLEGYDDFNVGVAFRNVATVSITYSLLSRCGLEPEEYFEHEDFLSVFDWNTPAAVAELGTAVSTINQEVLRQIEITIRQYEREHSAERTEQYEKQPDLHTQRGLPDPRPQTERAAAGESGQVREDAEEVPSGEQAGALQPPAAVYDPASAPAGDRPDGAPALGADAPGAGTGGRRDGEPESQRSDEVGGTDEHLQGAGRGGHSDGVDLQLTPQESEPEAEDDEPAEEAPAAQLNLFGEPMEGDQISLFPSEAQQIQSIAEAESAGKAPFAFSIPQQDIDLILRFGSNTENSRMRVAAEFMKQKSPEEIAAFLKKEYHGGFGLNGTDGDVSAWYAEDGIHLSMGLGARYVAYAQIISWEDAAARIGELLDTGAFATNVELIETPGYERNQVAQALWYMSHDMSDEAKERGFMSSLNTLCGVGFPEETDHLTAMLADPANVSPLISELETFAEAHAQDRDLMRFQHYKPAVVLEQLRELTLPRREYASELAELLRPESFITEDEIALVLSGGSNVEGSKGRVYAYFQENHTLKEQATFLKEEYGTGGGNGAVSGNFHSWRDYSSKGIVLKKPDCYDVQISWNNVAKRISTLIHEDKYLMPEEKAQLQRNAQRNSLNAVYNDVKHDHPDDIVLFQVGDFFEMYGEDAKQAAELLGLHLTTRPVTGAGRVEMCGVPAHTLEQYVEQLRDKYDVTISAVNAETGERGIYTLPSIDHEAERAIDAHEAEFGADGTRVFRDPAAEGPAPTVRELYGKYKPVVTAAVMEDMPYRNACGHSDHENAVIEGNAAIKRAILNSNDLELIRLYSDVPEFRSRLHQEIIDETYPQLHELLRPLSQDDIDDALRAWNGNMDSKRAVVRYMKDHARDRDTAAWLSHEYGGDEGKNLFIVRQGSPESVELPWAKVQRRIAQLIQKDAFYTEEELDNFEDIDPATIREDLESGRPSAFVEQVMADVERIAAQEASVEEPIAPPADMEPNAEPAPSAEEHRNPLAPAYREGDTVYLDDTAFLIDKIQDREVSLRDPTLAYPIFRAESKETFERLLRRDERNNQITDYLSTGHDSADGDLWEVLTAENGLLSPEEREMIASWLGVGDGNTQIAQLLSEMLTDRAETMELETGETADYFTSAAGIEINILDSDENKKAALFFQWRDVAAVLRAEFLENSLEKDAPIAAEPEERAGSIGTPPAATQEAPVKQPVSTHTETVAVYPAERNHLPYDVVIETLHIDEPQQLKPENFRITDDNLGVGGKKAKFRMNMDAIHLLKELEYDGRQATPEEQEILSRYVGWGGLAEAFEEGRENWSDEFKELYATLSPEEYAAARASTLNSHYTSPTVIKAIYEALGNMGFTGGNILEPSMGVGNFFGLLPDSMAGSKLYGVELDSITGRIAKQLYPKADITVAGFETTDRRDFYDVAVGNVPFGQYSVNDRAYNKLGFSIHDYFFAKSLDQVRPGGVVAFVTSRYTMDKQSPEVRKYIAQRAELLGAIRLPNNAFKANAGTEVVSDIIFLQKRDRPIEIEPDWVHLGQNDDGFAINSYFIDHPEMMLGTPTSESTQYGRQDFTLAPIEGADLAAQLHEAVQNIGGVYQAAELPDLGEEEAISEAIPADPNVKNYSYTIVDGEVYYRENSVMVKPDLNATAKERIKGMIALRDCVQKLIGQQMDGFISDSSIQATQAELNRLYDSYTAKFGLLNSRANSLAFADDSSYFLLCSLEELDEEHNLKRKADMFTKRTIRPHEVVTSVDTPVEALALSIGERGKVDMAYMGQLCGLSEEEIYQELKGVIFLNPMYGYGGGREEKYLPADEYLSGNVREKLEWARRSAQLHPEDYTANVEALEKAQPKDLDASEIDVRLGATWIDKRYIQQFMEETFDPPYYLRRDIRVNFSEYTAEWNITGKSAVGYGNINASMTYGTERANAYKILEETLNLRDIRIYDTKVDADGKEKRVLNSKETTLAQQKQQAIKDAFQEWVWKDPDRREALVQKYNELFNSTRPREYDGQHIIFSGMNPEIRLREHQLNAVAHILYGGNTLLAHEVGAGKTFEMVAAAMESKRLGLCSKSLFAVPNHLTEQWASEFLRLYPSANILVATKKDFEPHNRKKFCARIATGDYDAVIIGHSQFEKIPVSRERQERLLYEQIDEITDGIEELKAANAERFTIKQLEKTRKNLEARLEKLQDGARKDDVVTFEQLGVDRLYVDEAHSFKNLFLYTKMRNVAGLSTSDAQKSSDMLMKCRYIDEMTGGKGVVFATGTPVSNSMTELYTMMRYLQHDMLKRKNLTHFDCWASTFGETTTAIELAPEGTGYRARTRFAKFHNLPELMNLFKEVADIKTADQLNLPTPTPIYHNEVAQPTEIQKGMVQELSQRAAKVHAGLVDASVDNMLKITSDGRKLGLDQRVINPDLPDDPVSKVNMCVDNIARIWQEGQADKLTQLVFCDLSTPKAKSKTADRGGNKTAGGAELHALLAAVDKETPTDEPEFTVYEDIRQKLIARGIPAEQIAFIHDANTEVKKKELFAKVRSGQVRVLMGSTFKMGAGMNVQDRLIALHDLDAPWRPGDLEQRSGRIIRQGNMNPEVHIYRYVTEATFDAYLWQTLENKQKFISQIMTSKSPVRSCEDVDETALSYAEIKALCAGDERIKEKMDLDVEVSRLKLMRASHQSQQYKLEDKLLKTFPKQIEQDKTFIAGFEQDMRTVQEHPHPAEGFAGMTVRGDVLTDKENAGAALLDAFKDVKGLDPVPIGSYRGFEMSLTLEDFGKQYILTLKGAMSHRVELGKDARGNLTRIDNVLSNIENRKQVTHEHLESLYSQVETAKAKLGKPFPQEQEYKEKSARLAELNAELNIDDKTPMEALAEPETAIAKKPRQSILAKLKAPLPPPTKNEKTKEREVR